MKLALLLFAVFVGGLLPLQGGINASLGAALGHGTRAGMANFVVGLVVILGVIGVTGQLAVPNFAATKPWMWLGGVIGATVVLTIIFLIPKLGAAQLFACIVFGQLISSLVVDHFGLLGVPQQSASVARLGAVALVLAGFALFQFAPQSLDGEGQSTSEEATSSNQ
ncbi:MAG: transporter family-2 protein [Bradymonadia bacterium]